jgi:mono/diheme cytochrome c family protein
MRTRTAILILLGIAALLRPGLAAPNPAGAAGATIDFTRDIRPVLAEYCFRCHGPDEKARMANLRLDTKAGAFAARGSHPVIAPGRPEQSELVRRITADGPLKMPPAHAPKQMNTEEIALLVRWVREGASWDLSRHWAWVPPVRPAVPTVRDRAWVKNPIDAFLLAGMEREGLGPSPVADRRTLIRRLSFDLTGLPPAPAEVERFVNDRAPDAYERLVDRLLASPHFGERMAIWWLDLVRYADTRGYHGDQHQDITPYRDYVIQAFNRNLPFDRFTIEQLAGDLVPQATLETRIASGYNKLLMTTEEGGSQPKEYIAKYSADRVRNVSLVWMGATVGCAECHDHKYDPFTTRDFYSLAAFFADVKETPVGQQERLRLPTPAQAAAFAPIEAQMEPLRKTLATQTPELDAALAEWEKSARGDAKVPEPIRDLLAIAAESRTEKQREDLATHFRSVTPLLEAPRKQLAELQKQYDAIDKDVLKTMVTEAVEPREVRILPRGNWLDDSGPVVQPAVPAFLGSVAAKERRATRLDLARWLVSRQNPLAARVVVNHLWKIMFGQGLVRPMDDFGTRAAPLVYPELLDWLAVDLVDGGWNLKRSLKQMALSAAYRQSSQEREALRRRDPGNTLFARQSRFRLNAEAVRDNALAVSGLLVRTIGGLSAKPYQPRGYWAYLNFPVREWENDRGDGLYRRGLYTYWCRTYLQPSLLAFDAATREEGCAERIRSSTPQQALVLLNDPSYVEAARVFAERILKEGGTTGGPPSGVDSGIRFAFREALAREPRGQELYLLSGLYRRHLRDYRVDPAAAEALLRVGDRPADPKLPPAELAAWTSVARVILNLHESITRS